MPKVTGRRLCAAVLFAARVLSGVLGVGGLLSRHRACSRDGMCFRRGALILGLVGRLFPALNDGGKEQSDAHNPGCAHTGASDDEGDSERPAHVRGPLLTRRPWLSGTWHGGCVHLPERDAPTSVWQESTGGGRGAPPTKRPVTYSDAIVAGE